MYLKYIPFEKPCFPRLACIYAVIQRPILFRYLEESKIYMLTSKQRSKLRGMANGIEPVTQIGKGGISTNMIRTLSAALEARELIKVTVLESSGEAAKD